MAFRKTSVAVAPPTPVDVQAPTRAPAIGEIRDGMVWDGEKWVPEGEWKAGDTDQGVP